MQQRINSMVGIGTTASKEWTGALVDQGKELDRLRAKYSPLFATIGQYKKNVEDIKRAHALGAISSTEYQAAMSRERQAALASTAAIKGRNQAIQMTVTRSGVNGNASAFQTANIAAQFQDIGVTAAMGMNPLQIGLQQGTQLSMVFEQMKTSGQSAGAALFGAFSSILSPISLVTIGLTAGAAALIQYFSSAKDTKKVDEILKAHAENIAAIKDAYGDAAKGLKDYVSKSEADTLFETTTRLNDAYKELSKTGKNLASQGPGALTGLASSFKDFPDTSTKMLRAFVDLQKSVEEGKPRILEFRTAIAELANDTSLPEAVHEWAKSLLEMDENVVKLAESVPGMVDAIKVIGGVAGDQIDRVASLSSELKKLFELSAPAQTFSDSVSSVVNSGMSRLNEFRGGKTINEEARRRLLIGQSLAEQANDRKYLNLPDGRRIENPTPSPRPNVEMEGLPGEVEKQEAAARKAQSQREAAARKAANAAEELKKKQEDLLRTAGDRIEQIQLETQLVGKYGIAADNARFSLETWQKAEKLNLSDEQKTALQTRIDQYGQLADTLAKVKLSQDLTQQVRFNSLSKDDQQVSSTLKQYGLPDDLNSPEAKQIKQSLQMEDNRQQIVTFMSDFKTALVNNGDSIGKAFGTALQNALMKQADKMWDKLFNQLASAILGTGTGATGTTGTAATGIAGLGASTVGKLISPTSIASQKVTTPTTDISSYITQAALRRGIDPATALAVAKSEGGLNSWNKQSTFVKNGVQEPSFGPFQLYKGGGLGNVFQKKTGLDPALAQNGPAGVDFALDHASKNGWGSWYGAKNTGISNWQGIGNNTNMNGAADAVSKLAENSKAAAANVGTFGTGLGKIGQSLGSGAFPAAPAASGGGSGIFGWLGGLFGGASKSSQWNAASAGKLLPGLFADGGYTGPGGKNTPAGIVHAGEFVVPKHIVDKIGVPALSTMMKGYADGGLVTPALVSAPSAPSLTPRSATTGANSNQPGILNVHIMGASGDDHVRMLVKQGVGDGLNQYNDSQVRGGFGTNQNRWTARKG
ncbi:hypothetical protein G6L79_12815 [Agrobacterium rhizogenes]|nr:hypothetical protein [Rhizobium rhizogenes]